MVTITKECISVSVYWPTEGGYDESKVCPNLAAAQVEALHTAELGYGWGDAKFRGRIRIIKTVQWITEYEVPPEVIAEREAWEAEH